MFQEQILNFYHFDIRTRFLLHVTKKPELELAYDITWILYYHMDTLLSEDKRFLKNNTSFFLKFNF